jgi:hypothetical protein
MKDVIFSKDYLYGVWKSAVLPLVKAKVEETENELDDGIVLAMEKFMDVVLKPKEK